MVDYNLLAGGSFALWGIMHVIVGVVGMGIFVTRGTESMLDFINVDASVNDQADRMSDFTAEFYHALFLIGLTSTILGLSLNLEGNPVGYWINVVLVANIEAAFVWFEVRPGHRPVVIAIISVGLMIGGIVFGWMGLESLWI